MAKKITQKKVVKSAKAVAKAPAKKVLAKAKKAPSKTPAKKVASKKNNTSQKKSVAVKKQTKVPAKKVIAKNPVKKVVAKKPVKKVVKQTPPKKAPAKKVQPKPVAKKKSSAPVKAVTKKPLPPKPVKAPKKEAKKAPEKSSSISKKETSKKVEKKVVSEEKVKTPIVAEDTSLTSFRISDRPTHHIAFSLEDLDAYFKDMANNIQPKLSKKDFSANVKKKVQPKKNPKGVIKLEAKSKGVATIFDILGFNPVETPSIEKLESKDVPRKWKKYYNKLVELRSHHTDGVTSRSEEVMKRSAKDDAGDLSSNGQHLADAGSASFERDLAYNMITNQTETLAEIDAAIKRIKDGTYGICEVTGKPIPEARLEAIPFARYTVEGQEIHEIQQKRAKAIRRENVFEMEMDVSSNPQKPEEEDSDTGI